MECVGCDYCVEVVVGGGDYLCVDWEWLFVVYLLYFLFLECL